MSPTPQTDHPGLPKGLRLISTAISFAGFGIGGLVIAVLMTLSRLLPGSAQQRAHRGQAIVHTAFRLHIWLMQSLGVMRLHLRGEDKLNQPGQLIIANHPSLIDVVCLISRIPHANCIVKHQLFTNPFTWGPVTGAGFISNEDPETMIDEAVNWLDAGGTMVIFPEGTRTRPGEPLRFQRGTANIALRANCRLTPVTIRCTPTTLTKAEPWYRIPARRFTMDLHVQDDIALATFKDDGATPLAVRRLTRFLEQYFNEEINADERHPGTRTQGADYQHTGS